MTDQLAPEPGDEPVVDSDDELDADLETDGSEDGDVEGAEPDDDSEEIEVEGFKLKAPKAVAAKLAAVKDHEKTIAEHQSQVKAWEGQRQAAEKALNERIAVQQQFPRELAQIHALEAEERRWREFAPQTYEDREQRRDALDEIREQRSQLGQQLSVKIQQWQAYQAQQAEAASQAEEKSYREGLNKLGWNDAAQQAAVSVAKEYGFTDEEFAANRDPRVAKLLKAHADLKQQVKSAARKQSIDNTPAVPAPIRPGGAPRGLSDRMSAEDWVRAREAQLRKRAGR